MAIISDWFNTLKQIFSSTRGFYQGETDTEVGGKPIRIAFVSLLIAGIINSVSSLIVLSGEFQLIALADILLAPLLGIVSIGVQAALVHLMGIILGFKNGYSETFSAFAYATVVAPVTALASIIPVAGPSIGLALGLFALYVQIRGIQEFQDISFAKAAVSVVVPVLIIIGILLVIVFAFSAALVALMGSTGAPPV